MTLSVRSYLSVDSQMSAALLTRIAIRSRFLAAAALSIELLTTNQITIQKFVAAYWRHADFQQPSR